VEKRKMAKTDPQRAGSKNLEEDRARITSPHRTGLGSHGENLEN
jgi:hypothetical protein